MVECSLILIRAKVGGKNQNDKQLFHCGNGNANQFRHVFATVSILSSFVDRYVTFSLRHPKKRNDIYTKNGRDPILSLF